MGKTMRAIMARRLSFTPELLANVRQRFEHSDEPLPSMAADLGCCKTTLHKLAKREGWLRYVRPPRDLTSAARLEARAEALACPPKLAQQAKAAGAGVLSALSPPPDPPSLKLRRADLPPPGGGEQKIAETADQLHAAVVKELAEFKAMRAQLKGQPLGLLERERSARTLSSLTATLHRLQTMQCAVPASGSDHDYDDMPADIDEFRNELARRIEAFLASRPDEGDAAQAPGAPAAAAR